jgi:hypothetical protein
VQCNLAGDWLVAMHCNVTLKTIGRSNGAHNNTDSVTMLSRLLCEMHAFHLLCDSCIGIAYAAC